ncbi:MAG: hypothetical protein D6767_00140, partial [Candidatus Hydrogenedentota bacterium]
ICSGVFSLGKITIGNETKHKNKTHFFILYYRQYGYLYLKEIHIFKLNASLSLHTCGSNGVLLR